jgi:23S rRNA (adenine2503-C2)-methyltransferase
MTSIIARDQGRRNLFGLNWQEIAAVIADWGEKPFRAKQIEEWIYVKGVTAFDAMTNLSKALRSRLSEQCEIRPLTGYQRHFSNDGSIKYVFPMGDGQSVEAVYMEMEKGVTLCLSSQVGCIQDCSFCLTAKMGFVRNLSPAEIVGQVYAIRADRAFEGPFNVVMMGMGEPLLNLANLIKSLELLTSERGFWLSPKRITVSTSGHVRNLLKLGELSRMPRIAVSLNATTDEQRDVLMPVNTRWNIEQLIDACKQLPIPPRDRITIEYVLIKDVNDSPADAKRLVRLLANLRCKVNLIPFNETEGLPYQQPDEHVIQSFRDTLERSRIRNTIRWSKGRDIGAACGQLATPVK